MSKVQGGAAKSGSVFEPFELTHAAKKLAGKVMHLVCLFISYLLTPRLLDIFRLSALDKDKCQTSFFLILPSPHVFCECLSKCSFDRRDFFNTCPKINGAPFGAKIEDASILGGLFLSPQSQHFRFSPS